MNRTGFAAAMMMSANMTMSVRAGFMRAKTREA